MKFQQSDFLWAAAIVGAVLIFKYSTVKVISQTSTGAPLAGQGTNPYDVGEYSVSVLAAMGGM